MGIFMLGSFFIKIMVYQMEIIFLAHFSRFFSLVEFIAINIQQFGFVYFHPKTYKIYDLIFLSFLLYYPIFVQIVLLKRF